MFAFFKRFGFAATVVSALALMALVVAGKTLLAGVADGSAPPARGGVGSGGRSAVPSVVAVAVARRGFSDGIQAIGTAQARESIIITPKAADTIRALRFDSGDRVRAGQVLVEMSSVEQAASLAEAQAANAGAQEELRRFQELYDRGFASQARLDAVRSAADAAMARVNAGASRAEDRTLRAPFAGVVGLRSASPGQFVRPGDQIGTLDDLSQIKLDFDVTETQIARLREGVAIVARSAAFPDRAFAGTIANVDSRVDPATRTVRVRAMLPNEDGALRAGMLLTVEVRSNPREALAVPEIAILDQADGAYVYRVATAEGGAYSAELAPLQAGLRNGGMVEVLGGLSEGDLVITEGVQNVRPGQPVRLPDAGASGAARTPLRPRG
ncbi:MAG: efflux RND transporter periplasmic adaptor subunit [Terricaulis sp.]